MKWRSLEESTPGTDTRPLHDIFAERKELIAKYVPPDTQAVHTRVIAELKERHVWRKTFFRSAPTPQLSNSKITTASRFHRLIC